jgi:Phospholipase_D-nuclease N-terminal
MMNIWESFWGIFWFFFWAFAVVAYLFALFAVVIDIFRDRTLNGGLKALWLIFMFFVPFLAVLIYVIARGQGMAERSARASYEPSAPNDDYNRPVATASPAADIAEAKQLLDSGVITAGEFDALKNKALGSKF